jgi:hypothetical protein
VDIEYNDGSRWVVLVNGASDSGTYSWIVPSISTDKAGQWMKGKASGGNAVHYSGGFFSIKKVSDEGGEQVGERQTNSFKFKGTVNLSFIPGEASSIKLEFLPDESGVGGLGGPGAFW